MHSHPVSSLVERMSGVKVERGTHGVTPEQGRSPKCVHITFVTQVLRRPFLRRRLMWHCSALVCERKLKMRSAFSLYFSILIKITFPASIPWAHSLARSLKVIHLLFGNASGRLKEEPQKGGWADCQPAREREEIKAPLSLRACATRLPTLSYILRPYVDQN